MNGTAHIGPTISIKGEVKSEEPLTIAGHVDGSVEVVGHPLTIEQSGKASAGLLAATIVVHGKVQGSICAHDSIVVSETAVVDGELAAPAIRMADGAKVQGRIDAGGRKSKQAHPVA